MSDPSSTQPTGPGGPPPPPPQAPPVPEAELRGASGASGPRAGFWRRFGATIVDVIVIGIPVGLLFAVVDTGVAYLLYLVISVAYYVLLEGGATGQTLGKKLLGIRVIDINAGGSIGYGRAALRFVVEIISGAVIYLGYLWMLWDREKQTWHDKAASSVVVPVDAYPIQA